MGGSFFGLSFFLKNKLRLISSGFYPALRTPSFRHPKYKNTTSKFQLKYFFLFLVNSWSVSIMFVYLGMKKIFSIGTSLASVAAYEALGFDVVVDDVANGIYYAEADLTDYDWLAVLGLLEDCEREGLQPVLQYGEELIDGEEAIAYADKRAAEEHIND